MFVFPTKFRGVFLQRLGAVASDELLCPLEGMPSLEEVLISDNAKF